MFIGNVKKKKIIEGGCDHQFNSWHINIGVKPWPQSVEKKGAILELINIPGRKEYENINTMPDLTQKNMAYQKVITNVV